MKPLANNLWLHIKAFLFLLLFPYMVAIIAAGKTLGEKVKYDGAYGDSALAVLIFIVEVLLIGFCLIFK